MHARISSHLLVVALEEVMRDRVLFVDDEQDVLDGYERLLHKEFDVRVALGGRQGLAEIEHNGPFAVIISDMRMPQMTGAEFLAQARHQAPDSVRMLLTGFTDLGAAIDAINEGNIFRFLTKPCEKAILVDAINIGVAQYRQITTERELIKKAQALRASTTEQNIEEDCEWDNGAGPTGLPGPTQARQYVNPLLGQDKSCFIALLKLTTFQVLEERYGEESAAEYLNYVGQSLIQGLRADDRVFHWGRDVFMVVLHRRASQVTTRIEIARVTSSNRDHLITVNGRNVMITTPISFGVTGASLFSGFDEMLQVLDPMISGRECIGG